VEIENGKKKHQPGEMKLVTDTELLARFYGEDDELDHNEKFLRNYILNEGWKEKQGGTVRASLGNSNVNDNDIPELKHRQAAVDDEDAEREDEMDKFECKYNFRFEDPNAATITSHARNAN
jgi:protein KRI1